MYQFGAGFLFGNPVGGNEAANPTPQQFGTLSDVSVEISQQLKELRGNYQFPDDVAPGDKKISGKAKFGRIEVDLFNQLFFGQMPSTGITVVTPNEPQTAASSTFTVTHSATFGEDLGVIYATGVNAGKRFQRVASSPTLAGTYSVVAGVYTLSASDATAQVNVSYTYTPTTNTVGETLTVTNQNMGYGPVSELYLVQPYQGTNGMHLYQVRFSKLSLPLKRDDYQTAEMDFEAYANAAGNVMDFFQISI